MLIAFEPAARAPATRVGRGLDQTGWDVEVNGRTLGVPYVTRFPLYVSERVES